MAEGSTGAPRLACAMQRCGEMKRWPLGALAMISVLGALPGCPVAEQTEACRQFVACVRELDARDGQTTDAVRFEPDGDCWSGATIAELCDRACTRGVEQLRATAPDLACEVAP